MVKLYRPAESNWADEIEAALQDMVIAHQVVRHDNPLPVLYDEGHTYTEPAAIKAHLAELAALVQAWRMYQSDSCYVSESGSNC